MSDHASQPGLFDGSEPNSAHQCYTWPLPDADVVYYPQLFSVQQSDAFFTELLQGIGWQQPRVTVYGRTIDQPRLTAWHGDPGRCYSYSGIQFTPLPWTETLLTIKLAIEAVSGVEFNSVLLNLYRNERDSVSWHADAESELGTNPVIGSVSFGATRLFEMKHRVQLAHEPYPHASTRNQLDLADCGSTWNHPKSTDCGSTWNHPDSPVDPTPAPTPIRRLRLHLQHGSYLLMRGPTQHHWLHQVPKQTKPVGPRINLTFRVIVSG